MFRNVRKEEITIPAQMSYLLQIRQFVEHIGKKYRFSEKVINSFKLVVDEACTNIIRHGYVDVKNGEITLKAIIRRLSLTIVIIDQGKSFDPRQANTPDLAKYVDIGKRGGLGILMMRKLMDDINYTVTEHGNEFRLTKNREASDEPWLIRKWNDLSMRMRYTIIVSVILTFVMGIIFIPLIFNADTNIRNEILARTAMESKVLSEYVIDDILNESDLNLFEKVYSLQKSNPDVIYDVSISSVNNQMVARSDLENVDQLGDYVLPDGHEFVDSIGQVVVYKYTLDDTLTLYELTTPIHQNLSGTGALLGYVHVRVPEAVIETKSFRYKIKTLIIVLLVLILSYIGLFFLISKIMLPFHGLAEWVRQVVHGKVDQDEIDIDTTDEIGEIAQAFNQMTHKFREAQVTLMEQQRLQKELQVAQEIQHMLLPSDFPSVEGYDIGAYYEAAKEVGGDLFDFVTIDEDTTGICVADVSGKGVPGSMIMTMIRTALRLESRGNKNPADVLAKVNRFVTDDMKRGMFVTMFYLILDSRNRVIHYASAGHNPMILYRGSTKQTYYLNPTGFPVGIQLPDINLFDKTIESDSIRLREDDILVLYTDGITEAMNNKRELYRDERFLSAIRRDAHMDVGEFVKSIQGDIAAFTQGAPQNDDITFVAVKEKMMHGDVVYKVQKELFELVESGRTVKEACEMMRVSQYHYYKYKSIVDQHGLEGLKEFLSGQDLIEKKHISLEVKTKIFDIIKNHPEYGTKRICKELDTEKYGFVKIDERRLYNELVKMKLNTREKRIRFVQKGGSKKHIKQPGTPLLTLDGKVILGFESSESEIEKSGHTIDSRFRQPIVNDDNEKRTIITSFSPSKEELENKSYAVKPKMDEQEKRVTKSKQIKQAKKSKNRLKQKTTKTEKTKTVKKQTAVKKKSDQKKKTSVAATVIENRPEVKETKNISQPQLIRDELLSRVAAQADSVKLDKFYASIKGNLNALKFVSKDYDKKDVSKNDIKKIIIILSDILTSSYLKDIRDIRQIIEQIRLCMELFETKYEQYEITFLNNKIKLLLNYIEKINNLTSYDKVFRVINEVGSIYYQLKNNKQKHTKSTNSKEDQLELIRKKLAQKDILKSKIAMKSLIGTPEK